MELPKVSVAIICFNQVDFISKALESVINQEYNYKFEIVISDDASNDGTADILKKYAQNYPDIIRLILRQNNVGPSQNLYELFLNCKGEFIAVLEGDDYWTDKFKLKKQIDFLEAHSSYIACTHRYKIVDERSNEIQKEYAGEGNPLSGNYKINEFENYIYFGLLGSLVFRNKFQEGFKHHEIIKTAHPFICDITINLFLVLNGEIFIMDNNMAAHRIIVKKNGTNFKSLISKKNQFKDRWFFLKRLEEFASEKYHFNLNLAPRYENLFLWSLIYMVRYPSNHNWQALVFNSQLIQDKRKLIKLLFKSIIKVFSLLLIKIKGRIYF